MIYKVSGFLIILLFSSGVSADATFSCGDASRGISAARLRLVEDQEIDPWEAYLANPSDANRNFLVEKYSYLLTYHAAIIARRTPQNVEEDDLVQVGFFGLLDAIAAYKPDLGVKFQTYAVSRIRGAMLDYLRETDWVPRLTRDRSNKILKIQERLRQSLEREPTDDEIILVIAVSIAEGGEPTEDDFKKAKRVYRDSFPPHLQATSTPVRGDSPDTSRPRTVGDMLEDPSSPDPGLFVQDRDGWRDLQRGLSRVERMILDLYYIEGLTMREIGPVVELSESRVSQLHTSIMERLKARHTLAQSD